MTAQPALITALRAALDATPDNVPLRVHLADLLAASGDLDGALAAYRQALDLTPDDLAVKHKLAETYFHLKRLDVAQVILEELLSTAAPPAESLLLAARVYLAAGALPEAARAYRQAVSRDPALADPALDARFETVPAQPDPALVFVTVEEGAPGGVTPERPSLTFADVGGMDKVKEQIRLKIIYPLTHPDIYAAYGKKAGGGILLYGPPGCGKTYLARATAGEVQAVFLSVGLHDVLDMYLGNSERNLHALFETARQNAPCILFFDEVDALGASRADMRYHAGRQLINQFLAELDGVEAANEGVLILAATNAPWHVDPAMRRPGRFDRVIFVPPPDAPAREAILRLLLAAKPTRNVDVNRLARMSRDFSGADLLGAVDAAVEEKLRHALHTGIPEPLTTPDLAAAIQSVRPTLSEWFATARNYALYANEGGLYNDVLDYLKLAGGGLFAPKRREG